MTSLRDETAYPTAEFEELYILRWGIGTSYDRLKNRLLLENFTERTVKAVQQGFYAMIYITGLETLFIQPA